MIELRVNPSEDAILAPAMARLAMNLKGVLSAYKDKKIDAKTLLNKFTINLTSSLTVAIIRGYDLAKAAGKFEDPFNKIKGGLITQAKLRAKKAAKFISKTTVVALEINAAISKKNVATKERAEAISKFEMPRMFFMGQRKGWSHVTGVRQPTKRWFTTNDNSCEVCQENEDAGSIPVDEAFPSGDFESPLHKHCDCTIGYYI